MPQDAAAARSAASASERLRNGDEFLKSHFALTRMSEPTDAFTALSVSTVCQPVSAACLHLFGLDYKVGHLHTFSLTWAGLRLMKGTFIINGCFTYST